MRSECRQHVEAVLEVSRRLLELADWGGPEEGGDACLVFDAIARDCAYKIRNAAEAFMARSDDYQVEAS
ncbi:MAG: hypothetical protein ACOYXN_06715 [Acidobacteriota bacterium]